MDLGQGPSAFWAFRRGRSGAGLTTLMLLRWILALTNGSKVGIHLSDISGAFDKVSSDRLLEKLKAKGINAQICNVLSSWLRPRTAYVIIGGSRSSVLQLKNMVYQGTVLGPALWNTFYEDARYALIYMNSWRIVN